MLVEEIHRCHVHGAANRERAAPAGIALAAEIVAQGGLGPAMTVDGVEARVGVEVPHVHEIAHVEIRRVDGGGGDQGGRPVEIEPPGRNVEAALSFFGVKLGKIDGERAKPDFARRDVAEREVLRAKTRRPKDRR